MNQRTYVMLKPDASERRLLGKLITRIEEKGFNITNIKMMRLTEDLLKEHYAHQAEKPFFKDIIASMMAGPVVGMIVEGEDVVEGMNILRGPTRWLEAQPGTIRGDYAFSTTQNLIHVSETIESAEIEIKRFFGE